MGYAKCEIRLYKKLTENTWSSSYTDIPISSVDLKEGIEATKDTFKFNMINANKIYKSTFGLDDRVALYMYRDKASAEATDLVIDGMITEIDQDISTAGRKLTIKGANRTQYLLGALVQIPFVAGDKKCYEAIQEAIKKVNNLNAAEEGDVKYIDWEDYIVTTKKDATDFPNKAFIWTYKPAYKAIEEWSTDEYTEDGGYIFWIDTDGKFHWTSKPSAISYTLSEGDEIINKLSIKQGSWDVFNAVIASVGKDCYGHGNHILEYNPLSMADTGTKWKYMRLDNISAQLITEEVENNTSRFNLGSDNEVIGDPFPTSYVSPTQYEMQFNNLDNNYEEVSPATKEVSSDAEFNLQIRRKARVIGREQIKTFLDKYGEVRYKSDIEVNGTLDYVKGNLLTLSCDSHDLSEQKLRIMDIQHRFSSAGWTTILSCEEDYEYSGEL